MKIFIRILLGLLLTAIVCISCRENELFGDGEGALSLNISMESGLPSVPVDTRATLTDEELLQKCKIYIRNSEGLVRKYATIEEMPNQIQLIPDVYKAEVTAGDSVAASFTDSYFKGSKEFTIVAGKAITESVVCGIRNTVVNLNLSDELNAAFSSYTILISNRMGKLEYTPENIGQQGYFMLLDDENQLRWSFTGEVKGSKDKVIKSGVINLIKKATKYDLTFENPSPEVGGSMISVKVIETALTSDVNVELLARPLIKVIENANIYDLDNPIYRVQYDKNTPIVVRMAASVPFTELQISSIDFDRLGIKKFSSFDLMGLTATQIRELDALGFFIEFNADTTKVQFTFKENLREAMTASIDSDKNTYKFDIAVKDRNGKTRSKTLTVIATDALVATEDIPSQDKIWATQATLYGSLVAETNNINFKYRVQGSDGDAWVSTGSAILNGKIFTCSVTGLQPGTTYEYLAVANGTVLAKEIKTFTTENAAQLENSSFEDWHQNGKYLYIYKNGGNMFWDSGNTGSATMNKSVTTNDSGIKHSGRYSAKLQSQFVGIVGIGAFAAGNIFVGKFLEIDGTDGILRFGRPFVSRPSKMKLYYKYISGSIDYSDHADAPKGSKDKGIIYVALGDWQHTTYNGEDVPVLVQTKKRPAGLFDPKSSNVIGYGEYQMTESTEGEDMIELVIPIKYRSTRKPTDIVVVGSASKYGDYFTGSTGSTLWLDDVELIYDDNIEFEK